MGHNSDGQAYYLFDGTDDDDAAIDVVMAFSYHTDGRRFIKKQFSVIGVEGYLNTGGEATVEYLFDFEGSNGTGIKTIGNGQPNVSFTNAEQYGGIGRARFGSVRFGSVREENTNNTMGEDMSKFHALIPIDPTDYYESQFILKTSKKDTKVMLISFGFNYKASNNNAVHAE